MAHRFARPKVALLALPLLIIARAAQAAPLQLDCSDARSAVAAGTLCTSAGRSEAALHDEGIVTELVPADVGESLRGDGHVVRPLRRAAGHAEAATQALLQAPPVSLAERAAPPDQRPTEDARPVDGSAAPLAAARAELTGSLTVSAGFGVALLLLRQRRQAAEWSSDGDADRRSSPDA